MVSFICDACQETVRKPKVESHYQRKCPNCWVLSCVDCGVRFEGDGYKSHNTCISEAEKYQGALYRAPAKAAGGKVDPQTRWTDLVARLAAETSAGSVSAGSQVVELLDKMAQQENVPRKQKKFCNFLNSAFHVPPNGPVAKELWDLLQKHWMADKEAEDKAKAETEAAAAKMAQGGESCGDAGSVASDKQNGKANDKAQVKEDSSADAGTGSAGKSPLEDAECAIKVRKELKALMKAKKGERIKVKDLTADINKRLELALKRKEIKAVLASKPKRYQLSTCGKLVSLQK